MICTRSFYLITSRYDPPNPDDYTATYVEDDRQLLEDWYAVEEYHPERLTPWLLRLVLDDRLTVDKHISMQQVMEKIQEEYEVRRSVTPTTMRLPSPSKTADIHAVCGSTLLVVWSAEGLQVPAVCHRRTGRQQACMLLLVLSQGLLDVIVSDENAPIKVVRIRIVDDSGGQNIVAAGGGEEGDELGAIKPQAGAGGDGQVRALKQNSLT